MKQLAGFIKKEFYHIFRDPRTLIVLFGIPVAQLLLFGYVITNEIKNAPIAILDHAHDNSSKQLKDKIISSDYFILTEDLSSETEIHPAFQKGVIKAVVVIEPGFGVKLVKNGNAAVQILADASDPNTANIITNYLVAIISGYSANIAVKAGPIATLIPESRLLYNPQLTGSYMFVPGIIAMLLMLISALLTSISITREKELGTMEVLLASPLKPFMVIIGKVLPYLFLSFIMAILILFLGNVVFEVPVKGNLFFLLSETLLYIFMALSLGILISSVTKTQQSAMMISLVALMLPSILLSGFIFPVENMPIVLQYLCKLMPPKYFITIIRSIMLKGSGINDLWQETAVLMGMTIFFIALSTKKYKIRLE